MDVPASTEPDRVCIEFDRQADVDEFRECVADGEAFDFARYGHWEGHGSDERWIPHFRIVDGYVYTAADNDE